jgi:(p)ppGpp synthase/HD superfamily hydrolase
MRVDATTLQKALLFATMKHQDQFRKGDGKPYILHPISVLLTLDRLKKSKNKFLLATAAVLHDVVEDCNVTVQEIADKFGYSVASIVEELTSDKEKIDSMGKKEYLLDKMLVMSSYALCIKLCDRLDNVSDLESMNDEFKQRTITETQFILDGLSSRKLTSTHKKIIKKIQKVLKNI